MASSSSPRGHLLVLAVVVVTASICFRTTAAFTITVDEACRKYTKHPSYCTHALSAKAGPAATTLPALAEQAVTLAAESGGSAVLFVKNLEKMPGGMPLGCLERCVGKFQAAVAELTLSRVAIVEHRDVARVKAWVKAARADGETCMDGCDTEGGADPTIIHRIGGLGKRCSIALALSDAAAHNS
jgi:pectinesterase inhibitor-like protein